MVFFVCGFMKTDCSFHDVNAQINDDFSRNFPMGNSSLNFLTKFYHKFVCARNPAVIADCNKNEKGILNHYLSILSAILYLSIPHVLKRHNKR
jgi:hypothetical protein